MIRSPPVRPQDFRAGLPQGSPLSPHLFVIYAGALLNNQDDPITMATAYLDDEVMVQEARSFELGTTILQARLDTQLARAPMLNIRYSPSKTEVMHGLYRMGHTMNQETGPIPLYDTSIMSTTIIKSLGVWIDHPQNFRSHAAAGSARARRSTGLLWNATQKKGPSPRALHHLGQTLTLPAMRYSSEVWWTGEAHFIGQTAPTYNTIVRIITSLDKWTPLRLLHTEAGMPPLDRLLSPTSMRYGICILLTANDHPCKPLLLKCIAPLTAAIRPNGTASNALPTSATSCWMGVPNWKTPSTTICSP